MNALRCAAAAALLVSTFAAGATGAQARSQFPAEDRFWSYDGDLPACDDSQVLGDVSISFNWREWRFTDSELSIQSFSKVGETGYRPYGKDFIPRRYCVATALFSDGKERVVRFNLIERGGFLGIGHGLEFCAVGLDREHAYSADCQAAGR
jgi:hypothetical protein